MAKKRVFSNVPFAVRNRPALRRPDGGTGRTGLIPSERVVGRTAAAVAAGVGAAEPGGTPEPGTARGPNHVDCDHRQSGANGESPARPSKVTNSDSAAAPADGTGH